MASRRLRASVDLVATVIISGGGLATIFAIFGIFLYLFIEVAPLFYSASGERLGAEPITSQRPSTDVSPETLATGVDEYMEVGYVLRGNSIVFYRLPSGEPVSAPGTSLLGESRMTTVARSGGRGHEYGVGTEDGRVVPVTVNFVSVFDQNIRTIRPEVRVGEPFQVVPTGEPIERLAYQMREEHPVAAAVTSSGRVWLTQPQETGGLLAVERQVGLLHVELEAEPEAPVTALLLNGLGERLIVAQKNGRLFHWDIRDAKHARLLGTYTVAAPGDFVTALAYLIGDRSIVMGTSKGQVSVWMPMVDLERGRDPVLEKVREFTPHAGAITRISPSQRDKGFLTADTTGTIRLHYSTTHQTLLDLHAAESAIEGLMLAPKANGAVAIDGEGRLHAYRIENEHPEATVRALFAPVLYEGYREPKHIWQSSGATDDFEPKFGLWPLIFGTLKGTIYAMLLATPIALLGAIYTAMFMSPNLRAVVKPVVEIMAALPTVVLGFLAGLWFAPLLERIFPGVAAAFLVVPAAIVLVCVIWQFLPSWTQRLAGSPVELAVFMGIVVGSVWLCIGFSDRIEDWVFGGDYKGFLQGLFGVVYDQRNALVIAFAMGIAVIPTIFSISEDSISNVPRHLIAGSLAMGATPWQTLSRLVLVSASPGLFSALMIGFGRAVGETMIVLMATGNTPLMEMNLFNGFRTLSANIAVEMPEAPHGSTLYRLLFLSGLILFAFTSIVNTIAEVIRQRLRERYSQF